LEKPKLFVTFKSFWLTLFFLLSILVIHLSYIYKNYNEFKIKPLFYTDVEVIQAYEKWKTDNFYTIIKVYSSQLDIIFFSRTKIRVDELTPHLRLKIFPDSEMSFYSYLGTSYINSSVNEIYKEESFKSKVMALVEMQHQDVKIANFYNAIYFAQPLDKELRQEVALLGVSHLIALSGFHLAILWTLLFSTLRFFYRIFQERYFPYRFDLIDVGFLVLILLAWYVWFVDAPPSLLRSYMMMVMGWILLILGVELVSLSFLTIMVLILLVIFPKLLLSLGFWFSVTGVFYIFLLLHYFKDVNRYWLMIIISFGIFILMLPIVHMVFSLTSFLQLASPFLSLLFTPFYPLTIGLHIIGLGDIFDELLIKLFSLKSMHKEIFLSYWIGGVYLFLSILSFYFKKLFYLILLLSILYFIGLFIGLLL
jgi:competence protein ComEC